MTWDMGYFCSLAQLWLGAVSAFLYTKQNREKKNSFGIGWNNTYIP